MTGNKIVVLDGYTLNPGDLSWEELFSFGDCTIYDRTKPEDVVDRLNGAEREDSNLGKLHCIGRHLRGM